MKTQCVLMPCSQENHGKTAIGRIVQRIGGILKDAKNGEC